MKIIKYILASIILALGILFTYWLSGKISVSHWGFAISVNFLFMIVFTLIFEKILPFDLSSKYFTPKAFEKNGRIYVWFGIKYYKYLLKLIGWEKIVRKNQSIKNKLESLKEFEAWTKTPEINHLFAAILVLVFTVWIAIKFSIETIIWLVIGNIIFNIYPVMLQRFNRMRVSKLVKNYLNN